jgi:hypothetical protein
MPASGALLALAAGAVPAGPALCGIGHGAALSRGPFAPTADPDAGPVAERLAGALADLVAVLVDVLVASLADTFAETFATIRSHKCPHTDATPAQTRVMPIVQSRHCTQS